MLENMRHITTRRIDELHVRVDHTKSEIELPWHKSSNKLYQVDRELWEPMISPRCESARNCSNSFLACSSATRRADRSMFTPSSIHRYYRADTVDSWSSRGPRHVDGVSRIVYMNDLWCRYVVVPDLAIYICTASIPHNTSTYSARMACKDLPNEYVDDLPQNDPDVSDLWTLPSRK